MFWLNLPRNMDEFSIFSELLKSTNLTQKKVFLKIRFLNRNFTTCQISKQKLYNVSDFIWNSFFKKSDFESKCEFKKLRLDWIYPVKSKIIPLFCIFKKHKSDEKIIFENEIFEQKIYVSDFNGIFLERVTFKKKIFKHVRFLKKLLQTFRFCLNFFLKESDFE